MYDKTDGFENAQDAFRKGDPRLLADWVRNHNLTTEQKEYVARALCGEVEKIDGRKVKPTTHRILNDYAMLLWLNRMVKCFELEDQGVKALNDSNVARKLANTYGYLDPDSVRRMLARRGKGIKKLISEEEVSQKKSGHEKK